MKYIKNDRDNEINKKRIQARVDSEVKTKDMRIVSWEIEKYIIMHKGRDKK